jgi:hypothetical protein
MSFTDIAQSLEKGVAAEDDELERLRGQLAGALRLIRAYEKKLDQLRASRSASTGNLKRTRAEIAVTMRGILTDRRLSQLSDREIARRTGLSAQSVGNWRRRIEAERASKGHAVHNGRRRTAWPGTKLAGQGEQAESHLSILEIGSPGLSPRRERTDFRSVSALHGESQLGQQPPRFQTPSEPLLPS